MRKYVLHDGQRVYFEDSPQHYEILCVQCGTEIPEDLAFGMAGTITPPDLPTIFLGEGAGTMHAGCITSYVAKKLAGLGKAEAASGVHPA